MGRPTFPIMKESTMVKLLEVTSTTILRHGNLPLVERTLLRMDIQKEIGAILG
jgi:hypothetical protein